MIKIERAEGGKYLFRAIVRLDDTWRQASENSGVCGQGTVEGPWVEAFGVTPDEALKEVYVVLGRLMLQLDVWGVSRQS